MKNITIQLTARHIGHCYTLIQNKSVDLFGDTYAAIKAAIKANTGGKDALLPLEVEASHIGVIYDDAAKLEEGYANVINVQIAAALVPQLLPYKAQEAQQLAAAIQAAELATAEANADLPEGAEPIVIAPAFVDMSVTEVVNKIEQIGINYYNQREANIDAAISRLKE